VSSSPTGQYRVLCPLTTMPRRFTDFLVMSCDLVTDVPLGEVLDKHRVNQGALTVLLARQLQEDKPGQKKKKTDD
jgi:NDP-sugar pyrophosphorylase family protein